MLLILLDLRQEWTLVQIYRISRSQDEVQKNHRTMEQQLAAHNSSSR